ncbi:MAG: hypothetical protein DWI10_05915 [Planctomycetota bacterium]|nr:MAG: hypothetical protein DWI10_05915 [Planctomycetota bacterium]
MRGAIIKSGRCLQASGAMARSIKRALHQSHERARENAQSQRKNPSAPTSTAWLRRELAQPLAMIARMPYLPRLSARSSRCNAKSATGL